MGFGINIKIKGGKRVIEPFFKSSKFAAGVKVDLSKRKTKYEPYAFTNGK